jgi:hypothetical protein
VTIDAGAVPSPGPVTPGARDHRRYGTRSARASATKVAVTAQRDLSTRSASFHGVTSTTPLTRGGPTTGVRSASHRALRIQRRRVLEDPAFRGADDSQLLQMADFCAHAAHRSVVNDPQRAPQFNTAYQTHLNAIIERPVVVPAVTGRAIRGLDYIATHSAHCVNRWPSMHP